MKPLPDGGGIVCMNLFVAAVRQCRLFGRPLAIAILLAIALFAAARPALADKRIALVIGNSTYQHARGAEAAAGSSRVMAAALQSVGFTLASGAALVDLDKAGLDRAIQDFGRQIAEADVALIYYAGHAVQLRGSNFLAPVDADPTKDTDIDAQMLHVGLLLSQLEGSTKRLNLVVLDACHDNPFAARGLTGIEPGLAAMHLPEATLVSYPTQPDMAVPATSDSNNLFAMTFAETVLRPGLDLFDVFNETGLVVKRKTSGAQQPFVSFSPISGRFLFIAPPAGASPKASTAAILTKRNPSSNEPSERAVLYDEDPADPQGRQYVGTVVWRTEQIKASGSQKAGLGLRGELEIPDRRLKMVLVLRRNSDPSLPASHVAELTFITPPDFAGTAVGSVPGMLMKSNEQARGAPIAGLSVKVTDGFFMVGFSSVESDRQRNMEMLKTRAWFDVPLVYDNKRRGILAIAKGASGDRAFADAFAAWDKTP
jgi:hypothetical protein